MGRGSNGVMGICIDAERISQVENSEKFWRYIANDSEGLWFGEWRAFGWNYNVDWYDEYHMPRRDWVEIYTLQHPDCEDQNFDTKGELAKAMLNLCNDMRRWVCRNDTHTYMSIDDYEAWKEQEIIEDSE